MSLIPIFVAGALVAGTVALTRLAGLSPILAGLSVAGISLSLASLTIALLLAPQRRRHRKMIVRRICAVARQDLTDLFNVLTFRR